MLKTCLGGNCSLIFQHIHSAIPYLLRRSPSPLSTYRALDHKLINGVYAPFVRVKQLVFSNISYHANRGHNDFQNGSPDNREAPETKDEKIRTSSLLYWIQMLKAGAPVAVLVAGWIWGVAKPSWTVFLKVIVIVLGVVLASLGEIRFDWLGFTFQVGGIVFEAIRLIMIQVLLSEDGQRMDPLVSLYYYAPVCAAMNLVMVWYTELASFKMEDFSRVGPTTLLFNAVVAFMLNVSSVFLVYSFLTDDSKNDGLTRRIDRQDKWPGHNIDRHLQEYPFGGHQRLGLGYLYRQFAALRIFCGPFWAVILLSALGNDTGMCFSIKGWDFVNI
ncbi:hypothetical protein VM1G_06878 [Cytospora mali]|uniref:Sugar phosphate transporter domain-containing protein n=1 Tax=Cytospora mali TaxID=578113 RepID=A0A194W583_CYTMA|nr:hypothetical protein VM1G_06878 [Valsa mali]